MPKTIQEQLEEQYNTIKNITKYNTDLSYYPENFNNSDIKYKIFTEDSQEKILKKLKRFQKSHKILNISFSTNTKYSKIFDREYTEFHFFIQYI